MTTTTGDAAGGEPLPGTLARALRAVERCASSVGWQTPEVAVLDGVRQVAVLRGAVEALYLSLVRELDGRGLASSAPVATTTEGFLRTAALVGASQARRDVAAARATAPGQPLAPFADALADGRRSRAHVDVAVRCLDRVPTHVLERAGAPERVVGFLDLAAEGVGPLDMDRAARQLLAHLDPDGAERRDPFDPASRTRRFLDVHTDATGMVVGSFQLDPVAGATLRTALDHASAPVPGADGEPDRRQPRQRRADALVAVAETALGVGTPRRGERPRVVVQVTPGQLDGSSAGLAEVEGDGPVSVRTLRRLTCDAVLQRVVTTPSLGPTDVGREHRLVTLAQRRALAVRDGGCVVPGCGAQPDWCDAHHVVHRADGGPSDLDNYALLCPGHHTAVHAGTWLIERVDGRLMVTPPRWVDGSRTPRPVGRHVLAAALSDLDGFVEASLLPEPGDLLGPAPPAARPGWLPPAGSRGEAPAGAGDRRSAALAVGLDRTDLASDGHDGDVPAAGGRVGDAVTDEGAVADYFRPVRARRAVSGRACAGSGTPP